MTNNQLPQCPKCSRVPRFLASHWMLPRGRGQHIRFARNCTLDNVSFVFFSASFYDCFCVFNASLALMFGSIVCRHLLVSTITWLYYRLLTATGSNGPILWSCIWSCNASSVTVVKFWNIEHPLELIIGCNFPWAVVAHWPQGCD